MENLSTRTKNALLNAGIKNPKQLCKITRKQFMGSTRNCGPKVADEIEAWLKTLGLSFKKGCPYCGR